jgi:hypothetical protein
VQKFRAPLARVQKVRSTPGADLRRAPNESRRVLFKGAEFQPAAVTRQDRRRHEDCKWTLPRVLVSLQWTSGTREGVMTVQTAIDTKTRRRPFHIPWLLGFCLFAAIAAFFLWEEHKVHILGALRQRW